MHFLSQSAVLRALGWSLFDSFWQMAILWLLYLLFINVFKKSSPHARHGLALVLLGTGAIWSIVTFLNAFFTPDHIATAVWLTDLVSNEGYPGSSLMTAGRRLLVDGLPYCSFLYLLLLGFLFIRYGSQYLYARRLKTTGLSRIQPECRLFVEETRQRMGIGKKVHVWLSSLVEGPVTLGFLKPIILIPIATAGKLSLQQMEAILLHELAHIRRNDYLLNLGVTAMEILFFFNPFSRWLIRNIQREREHRCDDLVMQFRYDPQAYIAALLSLAAPSGRPGAHPQLALAATGGNDKLLLGRVRRILRLPATHDRPATRSLIVLTCTLTISLLLGLGSPTQSSTDAVLPVTSTAYMMRGPERTTDLLSASVAVTESAGTRIVSVALVHGIGSAEPTTTSRQSPYPVKACKKASTGPSHAADARDDEDPGYVQVSEKDPDDAENAGQFASVVQNEKRDFSINAAVTATAPAAPGTANTAKALTPFVPNSSFSYKYIQDSARPDQQFAYLQRMASRDAALAVKRVQKELKFQLHVLRMTNSKEEQTVLKMKTGILQEQLKLQEQYLEKQQELLDRFDKAGKTGKQRVLKIVVI